MRRLASQHLIRNCSERVDITSTIYDPITGCLLGTHVLRCTEREAGLRDAASTSVAYCECDSEVRDDGLSRLEKNVLGFEITMNDAVRVCIVECVRNCDGHSHCLIDGQLLLAIESRSKGLTVDERH